MKTINLQEQFKFKSKNLITYLLKVKNWKGKEKTQSCQVLKRKMQEIGVLKKKT
jgi:hypothetical protein